MSLEPAVVMNDLDKMARELGDKADKLADVQRKLEPVENAVEEFKDAFIAGLWEQYKNGDLKKWPGEDVRESLCRKAMLPETLGRFTELTRSKKRLEARIGSLKTEIEARRSLLSALKVEMEATRG